MARKRKPLEKPEDAYLIPVMNLVCLLIPFLLLTATFVTYGVINVNAPRFNQAAQQQQQPDRLPLNLTILVTDQGFTISAKGQNLSSEGGGVDATSAAGPTVPKKRVEGKMDYDYDGLAKKIREIKDENEDESQINIGAEKSILYGVIVKVMDATRDDSKGELFPNVVLLGGVI
ncbi:MAG: biopolymer transporter ExbD [Pseudomonadota bacterium]